MTTTAEHGNLGVPRERGVHKRTVRESIAEDGTLIVEVHASFVVHHAAWCEITPESLAGLIERQGICESNIDRFKIVEANND